MKLDFEQVIFCAGCSARIAGRHFTHCQLELSLLLSFSVLDSSVCSTATVHGSVFSGRAFQCFDGQCHCQALQAVGFGRGRQRQG